MFCDFLEGIFRRLTAEDKSLVLVLLQHQLELHILEDRAGLWRAQANDGATSFAGWLKLKAWAALV